MSRYLAVIVVWLAAATVAQGSMYTYYEDHFDGDALGPAWIVWGTGPYTVADSKLQFVTEQGDFHNGYEQQYGVPRHVFLIDPPDDVTHWTAVTRVRYNTPDQSFEQVSVLAFADHDNNAKVGYDYDGGNTWWHVMLSEENGAISQDNSTCSAHPDFFWLRLDRNGNTYTGFVSDDATTNPDLVTWTTLASVTNSMLSPLVGIAGWNTFPPQWASGELAEFDYFRLQVVPEPAMITALMVGGMLLRRR